MEGFPGRYLEWVAAHGHGVPEAEGAVERPAVTPGRSTFFSPFGGTLTDHATEMLLWAVDRQPGWVQGRTVWELGCGGGEVAVACSSAGAREVFASDVDPAALASTEALASRVGAPVRTGLGALFDVPGFPEHVDLFVANLPHKPVPAGVGGSLWENGGPEGTSLLIPFLEQAPAHLSPGGETLLLLHSLPHPQAMQVLLRRYHATMLSWRRRYFEPTGFWKERQTKGLCWFEEDSFVVCLYRLRPRSGPGAFTEE